MAKHQWLYLSTSIVAILGLQACASSTPSSADDADGAVASKAYVTGSRLPYRAGSNMGTENVKGVSREGFKDEMNDHKMPHRVGN